MSSTNNASLVPVLDRTNYRQWAVAMKALIQSTGMWAYAMGKVSREFFPDDDAKFEKLTKERKDEIMASICHGLVAATGYLDVHFPYRTANSSFSIGDLISSPLPIVVPRYFFTLLVPSPSFLLLPSPSGTFHSRSLYVPLPSGSFCMLPMCSG